LTFSSALTAPVSAAAPAAFYAVETAIFEEIDVKRVFRLLIPVTLLALAAGCVVAPRPGYYYGPRAVIVAPAPAVVIRPY